MNKPEATGELIPVRDYAKRVINRRGFPVSVQYIYKLISLHKNEGKQINFKYKEIDKGIWIVCNNVSKKDQ
jgi:hypothetical protein